MECVIVPSQVPHVNLWIKTEDSGSTLHSHLHSCLQNRGWCNWWSCLHDQCGLSSLSWCVCDVHHSFIHSMACLPLCAGHGGYKAHHKERSTFEETLGSKRLTERMNTSHLEKKKNDGHFNRSWDFGNLDWQTKSCFNFPETILQNWILAYKQLSVKYSYALFDSLLFPKRDSVPSPRAYSWGHKDHRVRDRGI